MVTNINLMSLCNPLSSNHVSYNFVINDNTNKNNPAQTITYIEMDEKVRAMI